ncbi:MAG: hypothetical protein KC912_25980 [Proteobacteria bacterium]|nr:hypothetical protein [Pseudomonadota bacterium]
MNPRVGLVLALFALVACPKKDSAPEAPVEAAPEPTPDLESDMADHFGLAVAALSAVIEGDLEGSKKAQAELRDLDTSSMPEGFAPGMDRVKAAAAEGAEAAWLVDAAKSVAAVGQACGDCHAATGGGPDMTGAPPHPRWGPESEMMRHQWAASLMWLGLTAPSEASWQAGSDALSSDPLAPDVKVNDTDISRYSKLEEAVHAAATAARDTTDRDDAAAQYAEIIALCATCHSTVAGEKTMEE